jgi:hypothetical protein
MAGVSLEDRFRHDAGREPETGKPGQDRPMLIKSEMPLPAERECIAIGRPKTAEESADIKMPGAGPDTSQISPCGKAGASRVDLQTAGDRLSNHHRTADFCRATAAERAARPAQSVAESERN